ncbi:MAG TPA: type III-B CRISPR module-associated protein Cmr5 [Chloroflexi bacterium]|nr:type III-B CRISPR module-associated protein Cmr5 [Chloroflexota bacterium]
MQTRDQQYATAVYRQVSEDVGEAERKKYGSMAHKLPVLIRTAGLAQALAFVDTRGDDTHHKLLNHLAVTVGYGSGEKLLEASRTAQLGAYMHLTQKVLQALLWYKRYAQSVLDVDPSQEDRR